MAPSPSSVRSEPGGDAAQPRSDATVRFFERAGDDAGAVFEELRTTLIAGGASVEWLVGSDRPDLQLLVVRGGGPDPDVDADTRCWRFRLRAP